VCWRFWLSLTLRANRHIRITTVKLINFSHAFPVSIYSLYSVWNNCISSCPSYLPAAPWWTNTDDHYYTLYQCNRRLFFTIHLHAIWGFG
jgi:hypothetical protein